MRYPYITQAPHEPPRENHPTRVMANRLTRNNSMIPIRCATLSEGYLYRKCKEEEAVEYYLQKLSADDGVDIYNMLQEIPENENAYRNPMKGRDFDTYKKWLKKCDDDSGKAVVDSDSDSEIDDGWGVPKSIFWLYVEGRPVGMGKLRHFLTDELLQDGGHIGYTIRPDSRGKGYAKLLLDGLIEQARHLEIEKILLTIEPQNIASLKTALSKGGYIERTEEQYVYVWIDC